jgi:hypothetical protein
MKSTSAASFAPKRRAEPVAVFVSRWSFALVI